MIKGFSCPVCSGTDWAHIETYAYARTDGAASPPSKYSAITAKLKMLARILLCAKPRTDLVRCPSLNAYQKLRRDVMFKVWFAESQELELESIYCATCGFACYTPRPEDGDIAAMYAYLKQYEPDQGGQSNYGAYALKLDEARANRIYRTCTRFVSGRPLEVLDYGGGNGKILIPFRDNNHNCHLIDYNDHPVTGVSKLGDDINSCQIDKLFDVIICSHVLEHVSDVGSLIASLKRHLSTGGIIYAEVPQEIWGGLRIGEDPVTHINFFTRNSFRSLFLSHGFSVLDHAQIISNYGTSYMEVVWLVARNDTGANSSVLPADTKESLYPSRWYSLKKLFGQTIVPGLRKLANR